MDELSSEFMLVVIVALFCGDTFASEGGLSSLRYLIPVPRARLLRQKLIVAVSLSLSFGANLLLPPGPTWSGAPSSAGHPGAHRWVGRSAR